MAEVAILGLVIDIGYGVFYGVPLPLTQVAIVNRIQNEWQARPEALTRLEAQARLEALARERATWEVLERRVAQRLVAQPIVPHSTMAAMHRAVAT